MENKKVIAFAGCKDTTLECMTALLEEGHKIDLLITIDESNAEKNKVAGYMNLQEFAEQNNIEVYICKSYSLTSEEDKNALAGKNIDLLLVIGWQRLIPEWLLLRLSVGSFGMHGSPRPLPYGRGRSPMNWSLIQGKDKFITNLFKYNPGVDDGDILATEIFDINQFDTAQTCHYKNTLSMIKILKVNMDRMLRNDFKLRPQLDIAATFFPKRTEKDGVIFWDKDTTEIYNLIRGVTFPFPGAFTFLENEKIRIWKAQPFDTRIFNPDIQPGTILNVFHNGDFIVKTGSDSLLITEYETQNKDVIRKGIVLNSKDYEYKSPFSLPSINP